jgi:putative DNA primase/helicase
MALHWTKWPNAFDIWHEWSQTEPEKYNEADQLKTWESFDRPYDRRRITLGTIFHLATEQGWSERTLSPSQVHPDFRTDLGNTRLFVRRHGENIRYIPEWQKWIVWNDNHWKVDEDGKIFRLVKETVEAIYPAALKLTDDDQRDKLLKHAIRSQAAARLFAIEELARNEADVVLSVRKLDADPWLLGVQNGVIELKTGQFRAGLREDYITKRSDVTFDPEAQCLRWNDFLDTVTGHDAELKAYLQRMVGYTMTGLVREEVLFFLWGTGNNGKSTFRETVHTILGEYAIAADAGLLVGGKVPGGATPEIARLKGCRLVAINETAENDSLNETRVKYITSQDTITARHLHKEFFDFDPTHKGYVATNHKPIVHGSDVGIWRRIHLIPFTVALDKVGPIEKDFRERRLLPEISGILNWAVEGAMIYCRDGLNPPTTVLAATDDYRKDMDIVGDWLSDRCELDAHAAVPTATAYADYVGWAQAETGWALKQLKFRRNLTDRGFKGKKGTGGQRLIEGLKLKSRTPPGLGVVGRVADRWS